MRACMACVDASECRRGIDIGRYLYRYDTPCPPRRGTGRKVVVELLRRGGALRHGGRSICKSIVFLCTEDGSNGGVITAIRSGSSNKRDPISRPAPFLGQRGLLESINTRPERSLTMLRVKTEPSICMPPFQRCEGSSCGSGIPLPRRKSGELPWIGG